MLDKLRALLGSTSKQQPEGEQQRQKQQKRQHPAVRLLSPSGQSSARCSAAGSSRAGSGEQGASLAEQQQQQQQEAALGCSQGGFSSCLQAAKVSARLCLHERNCQPVRARADPGALAHPTARTLLLACAPPRASAAMRASCALCACTGVPAHAHPPL